MEIQLPSVFSKLSKLTSTCTLLLCILCSCLYVESLSGNAEMLRTCEDVNLSSRTHGVGATNAAEHMLVTVLSVNLKILYIQS